MRIASKVFGVVIILYVIAVLTMPRRHPVYASVDKVRTEILSYYETNNAVPEDLSFLQDEVLKEDIGLFQITWDPETRRIQSEGNWTFVPDMKFRLTLGLLGNPRAQSYGDPSVDLSESFPNFPLDPPLKAPRGKPRGISLYKLAFGK